MGKSFIYIALAIIIVFLMFLTTIFLIEINSIVTLGNRIENSLIGAGWAGFGEIDLEKMAERKQGLNDPETRDIYLNKEESERIVKEYIKDNLKLDDDFIPTATSYIPNKNNPVIINEIRIINPDELPIVLDDVNITRTTIKISAQIPMDIKGVGFKYANKNVIVDIDSFKY